jgi:hypothetical protein
MLPIRWLLFMFVVPIRLGGFELIGDLEGSGLLLL